MGTCSAPIEPPPLGGWTAGPSAPTRRTEGLMLALSGGRVLFAGGRAGGADTPCVTDVELFDPATMAWRRLAPLPIAMCGGAGVELDDGSIFVGIQLPGPQPRERSRDGSVAFVSYDATTNRWTQVASTAPPFNLSQLVPLRGREVLILGYDEVYALYAYTLSGTQLEKAVVPAPATYFRLLTVTTALDGSVTWFLRDASVLKSARPDAPGAIVSAPLPRTGISQAIALPDGALIADTGERWLLWAPTLAMWRDIDSPPRPDAPTAMATTQLADGRLLLVQPGRWWTDARLCGSGSRARMTSRGCSRRCPTAGSSRSTRRGARPSGAPTRRWTSAGTGSRRCRRSWLARR